MYKNKRGFTLIELLAVLCVIAILVSLALPRFLGQTKEAKFTQLIHDARLIEEASVRYYIARNEWPKTGEPYTRDQVLKFSKKIYDSTGRIVDTSNLPEGDYYDIDFKALSKYVTIYSDPKNFLLCIPQSQTAMFSSKILNSLSMTALANTFASESLVYILDPQDNTRLLQKPIETIQWSVNSDLFDITKLFDHDLETYVFWRQTYGTPAMILTWQGDLIDKKLAITAGGGSYTKVVVDFLNVKNDILIRYQYSWQGKHTYTFIVPQDTVAIRFSTSGDYGGYVYEVEVLPQNS